ncbi:hypothetical protein TNCV_2741811 [Trichonephila clavipes]|nr:hypothetical protein TNCV_2741811 [Trichonephila clavipes]
MVLVTQKNTITWECCRDTVDDYARSKPSRHKINESRDRKILRHGPRLSLNMIIIQIISIVKCFFRSHSPKTWEFQTIRQLAIRNNRRPGCIDPGLPPYTIITHSVKSRSSRFA